MWESASWVSKSTSVGWGGVSCIPASHPGGDLGSDGWAFCEGLFFSVVSVLRKELECKVEKSQVQEVGGNATEDQKHLYVKSNERRRGGRLLTFFSWKGRLIREGDLFKREG